MTRFLRFACFVVAALLVTGLAVAPASAATPGYVETTTSEPETAAPPVPTPDTPHCTVTMADRFPSNDSAGNQQSYTGTLTPPKACAGPWAKVVLTQTISVSGRQYDRVATLSVGGIEIYHGTTEEPSGSKPTTYTFSKDVTEYSSLLRSSQPYTGGIGNYVTDVYTGNYLQTVTMTYYRATAAHPAPRTPDRVVSVADNQNLTPGTPSVTTKLRDLPRNITSGYLETTLEGGGCDEQWFTDVPAALSADYPSAGLCGNGPYREADISLDGHPVAATHTFPHIYSGGIVPTLWRPTPAIGTFDLHTESVDVTPFAGLLTDGKQHSVTMSLQNINDSWLVNGNLFLYTDHHAARTHGALLTDDVAATAPLSTTVSTIDGGERALVTTQRDDVTAGYLVSSQGRVTTTVRRTMSYRNTDDVTGSGLVQSVRQSDTGAQTVTTTRGHQSTSAVHRYSYPLSVDYSAANFVDDQNFELTGHVVMTRQVSDATTSGRRTATSSSTENVDSDGTLARTNGVTTESDGHSTSSYVGTDVDGSHYEHYLASEHGLITKDVVRTR